MSPWPRIVIGGVLATALAAGPGCSSGLQNVEPEQPAPAPKAPPEPPAPFEPLLPAVVAPPADAAAPGEEGAPRASVLRPDVQRLALAQLPPVPDAPPDLRAPPRDARKTSSGLVYRVLEKGTGKVHPRLRSVVEVHYTGWTSDGKMFDSSVARGQPASFSLDQVIRGWSEGLQLMVAGDKARFWIPPHLAYGEHPGGGAPAGPLVFDVELIGISDPGSPSAPAP